MYKSIEELPLMMTPRDVSKALGIHPVNAQVLMNKPDFPLTKIGGRKYVKKQSFIQWLDSQEKAVN